MNPGVTGLVLAGLLVAVQSSPQSPLTSSTIVAVQTAPTTPECNLFCGEWTTMTLGEAREQYDALVKIDQPTQRQIQLMAALRLAIGTIEGEESCRLRLDPSCRKLSPGYRQPNP